MSGRRPSKVRRTKTGCSPLKDGQFANVAEAAADYIAWRREGLANEVGHYERTSTLRETIERAARAESPDGKHDHQRRSTDTTMRAVERSLLAVKSELAAARTFHDLFLVVNDALRPVYGAADLWIYDTALRIGAKRGLRPDRVYLHRGTRVGARRFHSSPRGAYLDLSEVPRTLRQLLSPSEIEDFLCIYKDSVRSWA
jgi:hypothetical protein